MSLSYEDWYKKWRTQQDYINSRNRSGGGQSRTESSGRDDSSYYNSPYSPGSSNFDEEKYREAMGSSLYSFNRPFENPAIKDYIQRREDSYKPSFDSGEAISHARNVADLNLEIMSNQAPLIQSYNDIAFDDWSRYNDKYTESLNWLKDQDRIFKAGENAQDRRLKRDAISSETFINNENNKYKKYGYDTQFASSLFGGGNFFT